MSVYNHELTLSDHNLCWERPISSSCLVVLQYGVLRSAIALGPNCTVCLTLLLIAGTRDSVVYYSILPITPHSDEDEEALETEPSFEVEMVTQLKSQISTTEELITSMTQWVVCIVQRF